MLRPAKPEAIRELMGGAITCQCAVCNGAARCPEDIWMILREIFTGQGRYIALCDACAPRVETILDYFLDQDEATLGVAIEILNRAREGCNDSGTDQ